MKIYIVVLLSILTFSSISQTAEIYSKRLSGAGNTDLKKDNFGEIPFEYMARANPDTVIVYSDSCYEIVKAQYNDFIHRETICKDQYSGDVSYTSQDFRKNFHERVIFIYRTEDRRLNEKLNGTIQENGISWWALLLLLGSVFSFRILKRSKA